MDLSILVFTVVVCGVPPLASSGAESLSRGAWASRGGVLGESSDIPLSNLPADNNAVDDNDDDDDDGDDDDAGALPGEAIELIASHAAVLLVESRIDGTLSRAWETLTLRGPPRSNLEQRTRSNDRYHSDQMVEPPAWTAADSERQPHHSSDDPQDVDDRDDDRDDDSAGALPGAAAALTVDRADGRRLIPITSGAYSPVRSEAHALRGPPSRVLATGTTPPDHDLSHPTPFFTAPRWHRLRAPPHSPPVAFRSRVHAP